MEDQRFSHRTMKTKKFTILHSNDMHGDFLAEVKEEKKELIGGLALLSGYINQVRKEKKMFCLWSLGICCRVRSLTPSGKVCPLLRL